MPNTERRDPARETWFPFGRLIVVSNRLPFAIEGSGRSMRLRRTVGGLVSAVGSFLDSLKSSVTKHERE